MDPTTINAILIMDSRGKGIETELTKLDLKTIVSFYPGGGMMVSCTNAIPLIRSKKPDLITVAGSICDITMKLYLSVNDRFGIKYHNEDEATAHFQNQLDRTYSLLEKEAPNSKINYATVIGIDLTDYNHRNLIYLNEEEYTEYRIHKVTHHDQATLDSYIRKFNGLIAQFNRQHHVPTPWTCNIVHKWYSGKHHNNYGLLTDGCHFGERVKMEWAKKMYQSYKKL